MRGHRPTATVRLPSTILHIGALAGAMLLLAAAVIGSEVPVVPRAADAGWPGPMVFEAAKLLGVAAWTLFLVLASQAILLCVVESGPRRA